jgi:hypothetical protein
MSELECLATVLRSNFCRDWDFKQEKRYITLTRDTGDHKETIRVSKYIHWFVTVKILDRNDEIFTPASYNAHHDEKLSQKNIPVIDKLFNYMVNIISKTEPIYSDTMQYGLLVEKERCNIGKPHNHFYVTQYIRKKMDDPHNIFKFLKSRYEYFKLD